MTAALQRGRTPPQQWVSGYDTLAIWWWGSSNARALGNAEHPFIAIAPGSTLGPIIGLNRTNSILMLNWIVWLNWIAWNRNVFLQIKPYLHLNCVLMLNWIIWNGTVFWDWNCTYTKLIVWYRTVSTFNCVGTKSELILN